MSSFSSDSNKSIQTQIAEVQEEYYNEHSKNRFFKSSQKKECANIISQKLNIVDLFQNTLYILPDTYRIYFDYRIFKTFIFENNFDFFLDYIANITHPWIENIPHYEVHLNMQSLSISGFERFRSLFSKLFDRLPQSGKLKNIYVYFTPSFVEHINIILRPFISEYIHKVVFYSKGESLEKLQAVIPSYH